MLDVVKPRPKSSLIHYRKKWRTFSSGRTQVIVNQDEPCLYDHWSFSSDDLVFFANCFFREFLTKKND